MPHFKCKQVFLLSTGNQSLNANLILLVHRYHFTSEN